LVLRLCACDYNSLEKGKYWSRLTMLMSLFKQRQRIDRLSRTSAAAAAACIVASRPPLFHIRSRAYNYNYNDIVLRELDQ